MIYTSFVSAWSARPGGVFTALYFATVSMVTTLKRELPQISFRTVVYCLPVQRMYWEFQSGRLPTCAAYMLTCCMLLHRQRLHLTADKCLLSTELSEKQLHKISVGRQIPSSLHSSSRLVHMANQPTNFQTNRIMHNFFLFPAGSWQHNLYSSHPTFFQPQFCMKRTPRHRGISWIGEQNCTVVIDFRNVPRNTQTKSRQVFQCGTNFLTNYRVHHRHDDRIGWSNKC